MLPLTVLGANVGVITVGTDVNDEAELTASVTDDEVSPMTLLFEV
jgi:hypothetical protein